jgi:hypothetical protein
MAILRNPQRHDMFSEAANRTVRRGQQVEITDEQAKLVPNTGVWEVTLDTPKHRIRRKGKTSEVAGKIGERR